MTGFVERMMGAAKLDVRIYEEVEADKSSLKQAMGVVILSSVAAGIGAAADGILMFVMSAVISLIGWFLWAVLTWFIGTKLLPEPQTSADIGQVLRTTGFSASPGLLRVLGLIPFVGRFVFFAAGIWMLVAMVVAIRQALDYRGTGRAVAVCLIGFIIYILIGSVLFFPFLASGGSLDGL